jgi:hypothetical protein
MKLAKFIALASLLTLTSCKFPKSDPNKIWFVNYNFKPETSISCNKSNLVIIEARFVICRGFNPKNNIDEKVIKEIYIMQVGNKGMCNKRDQTKIRKISENEVVCS